MARRTLEPFLWTLFSAGGVVAALFLPIHVLLFGLAFPLGLLPAPTYDRLSAIVHHPLGRLYLLALCTLPLVHAAHRFRYTLYDGLQIKHLHSVVNPLCYGGALVGSVLAVWLLWTFP
jgi:fumarate reductase subunit D